MGDNGLVGHDIVEELIGAKALELRPPSGDRPSGPSVRGEKT